ncbi:hypothetical protein L6R52_30165 [Myxococcota bacterium]|nr:hypothetical protein [Myxococcota bacterium]
MNEGCLSSLGLDLATIGAADDAARAHLAACDRCRARVDARRAEDAAFVAATPIDARAAAIERRARVEQRGRLRVLAIGAALAASIAGAVVFVPPRGRPTATERMKGATIAELFVDRGGEITRWAEQPLAEGDTLVFRYTTTRRHLLVLDVEASGEISVIVASLEGTSVPIEPGRDQTAPQGMRLDAYAGRERVIALFSDAPLEAAPLVEALAAHLRALPPEARAKLDLGPLDVDADVASWLLEKEGS